MLSVLALGALLAKTLQQIAILLGVAPDDPLRWIYPSSFAVVFVAGVAWAAVLRVRRPRAYEAIGADRTAEP